MAMRKNLVVVESPAKAKTIQKMLGPEFIVKSSMGHVRDLPVKNFGVSIKDSFKPTYVTIKDRRPVIESLKKAAKDCDNIYLAPDPDREGEAIAWHLEHVLRRGRKDGNFLRVQYNEITRSAVLAAFAKPSEIDQNRVHAQQARRILDRIVGYMVSPLLWRELKGGLSAGRVQSVALRLICEREADITSFIPQEYWIIGAKARKRVAPLDPFVVKLTEINHKRVEVRSREQEQAITDDLEGRSLRVAQISTRDICKRAAPPLITSSLQQACSSAHGLSPSRTMALAQRLYEGIDLGDGPAGLITYMRTDSFTVSNEAISACRAFITKQLGPAYCPEKPNFFKSRTGAQEAHEAIRPTDVTRTPESLARKLDSADLKVYTTIWRAFVASQMSPANIRQTTVKVEASALPDKPTVYLFHASFSDVVFPGFMKYGYLRVKTKKEEEQEEEQKLPPLKEGENLELIEWLSERKETQPPARFSEASLIRALEANGIGRPSTYAQTIATLSARKYVGKKNRSLEPTELGIKVSEILSSKLNDLFSVKFTADMEAQLDQIEKGALGWTEMLDSFYRQFSTWMARTRGPAADQVNVKRLLEVLEKVGNWADKVKIGKHTYSDQRFVESVREQSKAGQREVTFRQFETLARIAARYISQVPEIESVILESGLATVLHESNQPPPSESTLKKIGLLKTLPLNAGAMAFVTSLDNIVRMGRSLSPAQIRALDNILTSHSTLVPSMGELKGPLEVRSSDVAGDEEVHKLMDVLKQVGNWNRPRKSGRRIFNDRSFYNSLADQYQRRGYLTLRQVAALRKLVERYRDQIPSYGELVMQHDTRHIAQETRDFTRRGGV